MVGELFIFDCAVKAGEEEGRRVFLGDAEYYVFQKHGSGWRIGPIDDPIVIHSKKQGFEYIHFLIKNKTQLFTPIQLVQHLNSAGEISPSDVHEIHELNELSFDGFRPLEPDEAQTKREYENRINELVEKQSKNGLAEEEEREKDFLYKEMEQFLNANVGTMYDTNSENEKARINIRNIVTSVLNEIKPVSPDMYDFLKSRINLGRTDICYTPSTNDPTWITYP